MAADREEVHLELVQHRLEDSAHRALLAHHDQPLRLPEPLVPPIRHLGRAGVILRIIPGRDRLDGPPFLHDPLPRDRPVLTGVGEEATDPIGVRLGHRVDVAAREELVAHAADRDRLDAAEYFNAGLN
jgi:hypothetical protein